MKFKVTHGCIEKKKSEEHVFHEARKRNPKKNKSRKKTILKIGLKINQVENKYSKILYKFVQYFFFLLHQAHLL